MFNFFKRKFIKNYTLTDNSDVRVKYGIVAGVFGIVINILLFAAKIAVGILSGSVAVVADAVNNLSDAGSSVVTLFGFKLASRPPDAEHPYGHARYEYITGLIVAFAVLLVGVLLGKSSVEKIITPQAISVDTITFVVLGLSIGVKLFLAALYRNFGKSINSDALQASAADSRNDVISTTAVLAAAVTMRLSSVNIDGYVGAAVSLFVIISAFSLVKNTLNPLLGTKPDKETVEKIKKKLSGYEVILGYHDLMVHNYGPATRFASVHAEVDAARDFMEAHDLIDDIERDFMCDLGIHIVIHLDPVVTNDAETDALKALITPVVCAMGKDISVHDFRLVKGKTHTKILFDVVAPYGSKLKLSDITDEILSKCSDTFSSNKGHIYSFIINVEHSYV